MRMQGIVLLGAFLGLTPYAEESQMSDDHVYAGVEKALRKYFGKRGDRVVQDNLNCVKRGYSELKEIPRAVMAGYGDGADADVMKLAHADPRTEITREAQRQRARARLHGLAAFESNVAPPHRRRR